MSAVEGEADINSDGMARRHERYLHRDIEKRRLLG
jgi:hypothetical protein